MKNALLVLTATVLLLVCLGVNWATSTVSAAIARPASLTLRSTEDSSVLQGASYLNRTGLEMVKVNATSSDNGRTWTPQPTSPDFDKNLPDGCRRNLYTPFVDPVNGNIITAVLSLDIPVDPDVREPPVGEKAYYLRYRVSTDGGSTYLFDEPMVQLGKTQANPFDGVYTGQNGYYIGDGSGDRIIRTQSGRIIVPAQAGVLDSNRDLANPGGGWTYHQAMMILGDWQPDSSIQWTTAKFLNGDPLQSTRGMIEPTITEMRDGRLLCVMRGSNERLNPRPLVYKGVACKWFSVSRDNGNTWTTPEPWTYDDETPFYSSSAVSSLLQHSSGRCFWIGNIVPNEPKGNSPRYPLVIGEVDNDSLKLIKNTVIQIDTKRPTESGVSLSHMWTLEDRITHDVIVTGKRHSEDYKSSTPVTYRIIVH